MADPFTSAAGAKFALSPTLVAGLIGAIVSLRFASNLNWWERFTAVVSGSIMAQYIAPVICHIFGLEQFQEGTGFVVGLFGMSLTAAIYETIKKADIWALIMNRFGGGSGGNCGTPQ